MAILTRIFGCSRFRNVRFCYLSEPRSPQYTRAAKTPANGAHNRAVCRLRAAYGLLHHPGTKLREGNAVMERLSREQRRRSEAGLRVYFQQYESTRLTCCVVIAKVGARRTSAAKRAMCS